MSTYRVYIEVERAENGREDAVSVGPPECIFESTSRQAVHEFLKTLPGVTPKSVIDELKRRK